MFIFKLKFKTGTECKVDGGVCRGAVRVMGEFAGSPSAGGRSETVQLLDKVPGDHGGLGEATIGYFERQNMGRRGHLEKRCGGRDFRSFMSYKIFISSRLLFITVYSGLFHLKELNYLK
jgi:hypothetical protein